jgi:hypothetical protein
MQLRGIGAFGLTLTLASGLAGCALLGDVAEIKGVVMVSPNAAQFSSLHSQRQAGVLGRVLPGDREQHCVNGQAGMSYAKKRVVVRDASNTIVALLPLTYSEEETMGEDLPGLICAWVIEPVSFNYSSDYYTVQVEGRDESKTMTRDELRKGITLWQDG